MTQPGLIRNTRLVRAVARCEGCDWRGSSSNAQAVASGHARRYGHEVRVTITWAHQYLPIRRRPDPTR